VAVREEENRGGWRGMAVGEVQGPLHLLKLNSGGIF